MRFNLNIRKLLVIIHDFVVTGLALLASFAVRFEADGLEQRLPQLLYVIPIFSLGATFVYYACRLYDSKWRFASLPDLAKIFQAVSLLSVCLVVIDYTLVSSAFYGQFLFGKTTIALYWCLQMFFLGGPRLAYRYFRYIRTWRQASGTESNPALLLGRSADAELILRAIESGALKRIRPIGILSPSLADQEMAIRGINVLGTFDDLEGVVAKMQQRGQRIAQLVLTASALEPHLEPEDLLSRARRLGIDAKQLAGLREAGVSGWPAVHVSRIELEDLLLRPSAPTDYTRLERFVSGKAVVVTGGGGSIGAELCKRLVAFRADRLLIIENSEPALAAVLDNLTTRLETTAVQGRLADIRDRERMFRLLADFKPDVVLHAAALKHIPLLEQEWSEGIKTNVFGSANVADASVAAGAELMILISTDKAVEPVSLLGATKRLAEMYCQALHAQLDVAADERTVIRLNKERRRTKLISVRFGNVLGSNGSVVPKFKAQIDAGGPVTVTHPEMVRYFMSVREACDLVLAAGSHAATGDPGASCVYVLNMGQPVKIVDLAERMIRMSGYLPGQDIELVFTGIRDGERLQETLFAPGETNTEIGLEGVVAARPRFPSLAVLNKAIGSLEEAIARGDEHTVFDILRSTVPGYTRDVIGGDVGSVKSAATAAVLRQQ
ncbi:MAG: hypothetical protein QOD74_1956 [Variibacter sp.]|nr:hypothetical protein [Variibacter sp.]